MNEQAKIFVVESPQPPIMIHNIAMINSMCRVMDGEICYRTDRGASLLH